MKGFREITLASGVALLASCAAEQAPTIDDQYRNLQEGARAARVLAEQCEQDALAQGGIPSIDCTRENHTADYLNTAKIEFIENHPEILAVER